MYPTSLNSDAPGSGRERILRLLKTKGVQTASQLAGRLGVTTMAVRQHLAVLQGEELVEYVDEHRKVGRPARVWQLTQKASAWFPDHHAELAVEMLEAVRDVFGEDGLERLADEQTRKKVEAYRERMPGPKAPVEERVAMLTTIRREEGYMSEWGRHADGALEIVQNHCAIARAARVCPSLCGAELSLFRGVLGDDVTVSRVEHILTGDRCCRYSIAVTPSGRAQARPVGKKKKTTKGNLP